MSLSADFGTTTPVARKDRICDDCGQTISAGTQYTYWKGVYYAEFHTFSSHLECAAAVRDFANNFPWASDDGLIPLSEIPEVAEPSERDWLISEHPIAAARIGLTATGGEHG